MIDLTTIGHDVWTYAIRLLAAGSPGAATTRAEEIAEVVLNTCAFRSLTWRKSKGGRDGTERYPYRRQPDNDILDILKIVMHVI